MTVLRMIAAILAKVNELEKDAEELRARRWLDDWERTMRKKRKTEVYLDSEGDPETITWYAKFDCFTFTGSTPVLLAKSLGWRP